MRSSNPILGLLLSAFLLLTLSDRSAAVLDTNFPCTVGDWRSSETAKFLDKNKLWWWHDEWRGTKWDYLNRGASFIEIFEETCPYKLDQLSQHGNFTPIEYFFALCELKMQFPPARVESRLRPMDSERPEGKFSSVLRQSKDLQTKFLISRGENPFCKNIKDETRKMNRTEANIHFCNGKSPAVHNVLFDGARSVESVEKGVMLLNHQQQCRQRYPQFLKKN